MFCFSLMSVFQSIPALNGFIQFSLVMLELLLSELGLTVNNVCFLFLFGSVMFSWSSAKLSSLKHTSFFVTLTLWLYFLSVGGSWLPVNQTGTMINLSSHHIESFCSKDENAIFWFKDYNHIFIWKLTLLIAYVTEPGSGGKVNEDFCFKTLYNMHNSISYFHYKGLL